MKIIFESKNKNSIYYKEIEDNLDNYIIVGVNGCNFTWLLIKTLTSTESHSDKTAYMLVRLNSPVSWAADQFVSFDKLRDYYNYLTWYAFRSMAEVVEEANKNGWK
jgi:hypothetical protein